MNGSTGVITRAAGNGYPGYFGDGGSATIAEVYNPQGLALDSSGNLYLADQANYRIRKVTFLAPAATPVFSLAGGTYAGSRTVAISDGTTGAAIYFTTDGTTPTAASTLYSSPIAVSASETLQAIAIATGYAESAIASAAYTIAPPTAPLLTATVTVTPTAATITDEQTDAISVAVAGASGQATPTGTVTLSSGSYSAQQSLTNGAVSITIPTGVLIDGVNTLTATYSGDGVFSGADSTASVTVTQVVAAAPTPSGVAPGGSSTTKVTFSAGSSYSGTLNVSCALVGSPSGAQSLPTCSLSPTSVTVASSGSGVTALTVSTTAASNVATLAPNPMKLIGLASGGTLFAGMLMIGISASRRRWLAMIALVWIVVAAGAIGCGGGSNSGSGGISTPATTAGTYTFKVTGVDSAHSTITVATNISITVQ